MCELRIWSDALQSKKSRPNERTQDEDTNNKRERKTDGRGQKAAWKDKHANTCREHEGSHIADNNKKTTELSMLA